jgi:hypothetical protein
MVSLVKETKGFLVFDQLSLEPIAIVGRAGRIEK